MGALLEDPIYLSYVQLFASNMAAFDEAFASAWYKLTTRDMGPHSRCIGPIVPPPQPWQNPLPEPSNELADFAAVKQQLETMLWENHDLRGLLSRLAWRCSATFRATDYLGGCNGARIRLSPQKDWPVNANLDLALELLQPIKEDFGEGLSWADLIVLAGNTVMEHASGTSIPFCPGRTDGEEDGGGKVYKAVGSDRIMFATDIWYRSDGELRAIAEEFAFDNAKFVQTVVAAWDKLTTADRFLGPAENLCEQPNSRHHLPIFPSSVPSP